MAQMSGRNIWALDDAEEPESLVLETVSSAPIKMHTNVMKGCQESRFTKPNKVQLKVLPYFTESLYQNLLISASPRSGKTSSVILGILNYFSKVPSKYSLAVLLCPTYEVAEATYYRSQSLAKYCDIALYFIVKGQRLVRDIKKPKEIFIGTADKILDLSRSSLINLRKVSFILVDEADCLGNPKKYFDDTAQIFQRLTPECRYILCTVSLTNPIKDFVAKYFYAPKEIVVKEDVWRKFPFKEMYLVCNDDDEKFDALTYLLTMERFQGQVVIFCETRGVALKLGLLLQEEKIKSAVLIGDMSVTQRRNILEQFQAGAVIVLVTTRSFVSVIPVAGTTKLVHYDQIINEKKTLDLDVYKRREFLLTKTEKSLIVYFVEKSWEEYLFQDQTAMTEKGIDKIACNELKTYF